MGCSSGGGILWLISSLVSALQAAWCSCKYEIEMWSAYSTHELQRIRHTGNGIVKSKATQTPKFSGYRWTTIKGAPYSILEGPNYIHMRNSWSPSGCTKPVNAYWSMLNNEIKNAWVVCSLTYIWTIHIIRHGHLNLDTICGALALELYLELDQYWMGELPLQL